MARDASYWLNRMRDLQTMLDRLTLQAAALRNRADSLNHEFDWTWDRSRRSSIESERQQLRTELALVKADVAATAKQIFDLEDEARRSNVPPGWLRP
jgi:chromosome segregation ATPase